MLSSVRGHPAPRWSIAARAATLASRRRRVSRFSTPATGEGTPPPWEDLLRLAQSDAVADRAFATGAARLAARGDVERVRQVLATARARALVVHADARAAIRAGALRGPELRARIQEIDAPSRDHWVEEVLDIADPPLEDLALGPGLVAYVPSGVDTILFALDATRGAASLVDLGAGMGKVVLLAALVGGLQARGIEIDARLVGRARAAAAALDVASTFDESDARTVDLGVADVWFLYVPFTGPALHAVLDRMAPDVRGGVGRGASGGCRVHVCASSIDLARHPWLRATGASHGWLEVYEIDPSAR